jgi:hypothetical protein
LELELERERERDAEADVFKDAALVRDEARLCARAEAAEAEEAVVGTGTPNLSSTLLLVPCLCRALVRVPVTVPLELKAVLVLERDLALALPDEEEEDLVFPDREEVRDRLALVALFLSADFPPIDDVRE